MDEKFLEWLSQNYTPEQVDNILKFYKDQYFSWFQFAQQVSQPLQEKEFEYPQLSLPATLDVNGRVFPVNYRKIDAKRFQDTRIELDENGLETEAQYDVYFYAPVVPLESYSPATLETVYRNVYAVWEDGQPYNEGQPMAPKDIKHIVPYDPLKDTGDLTQFRKWVVESMLLDYARKSEYNLSPELKKNIEDIAENYPESGVIPLEALNRSMGQFEPKALGKVAEPGQPGFEFDPFAQEKLAQYSKTPEFRQSAQAMFDIQEQRILAKAGMLGQPKPENMYAQLKSQGVPPDEARRRVAELTGGTVVETQAEAEARTGRDESYMRKYGVGYEDFQEQERQKRFEELKRKARLATSRPQRIGKL